MGAISSVNAVTTNANELAKKAKALVPGLAVTDCENGRLVRTNDASELAESIAELLSDETLRKKLGSAACQTIRNKFTLQAELEGNLALYRPGLKM